MWWFSLKGTGFSPYVQCSKKTRASAPEGMILETDPLPRRGGGLGMRDSKTRGVYTTFVEGLAPGGNLLAGVTWM